MKVAQVIRRLESRRGWPRGGDSKYFRIMVRGKGCVRGEADIEMLVVKLDKGTPVLVRDIGRVELVPSAAVWPNSMARARW